MEKRKNSISVSESNPAIIKDNKKCVECGHCRAVCAEEINVAGRAIPGREGEKFCIHCGQCAAACPEEAIRVKSETEYVKEAVKDPDKIVIFSTSPSVRVGIGDEFLERPGVFSEGKMVSALRSLGADYVLDVTFSADLTIMEEGSELIQRIVQKGVLPQFTSCCPAWVKYVETYHPDMIPHLSSAKSPIGMQGALIKTYFAAIHQLDPTKIIHVAVTPCTAKKFEIRRPELADAGAYLGIDEMRDNDHVITTKELVAWMKEENVEFQKLPEGRFDPILGKGSGAGVIFGNTGGVTEAALRMAYECLTGESPTSQLLHFEAVRGLKGIKEATVDINGLEIRTAVVYGTANAEELLTGGKLDKYHFVEVMTCPGGCISGAGQPQRHEIPPTNRIRTSRMNSMYQEDAAMTLRNSMDNPEIGKIYREFLGEPLGERSEKLLHTTYRQR